MVKTSVETYIGTVTAVPVPQTIGPHVPAPIQ